MTELQRETGRKLAASIGDSHASHAFFISCPDDSVSYSIALRAASLVCFGSEADEADVMRVTSHFDYFELNCDKLKKVDELREVLAELSKRTFSGKGRAIVLRRAERLPQSAQNALLKSLEEPPPGTAFILTGNVDAALPTIASRCLIMRLGATPSEDIASTLRSMGASPQDASLYSKASVFSLDRAEKLFLDEDLRALRSCSLDAMDLLLSGELPINLVSELRADPVEAVAFMESYARDILLHKLGERRIANPDRAQRTASLAARFTIGKLTCIISMFGKCAAELVRANKNALLYTAALNGLFLDISQEI